MSQAAFSDAAKSPFSPKEIGAGLPDRVQWVDYAKGFCIIFVVMMHSTLGVEKAAGEIGWMHYLVQFAKPFRMPDFFMISGLFLGLVISRPWLRYIDRKVVHFAYFYLIWMTIQFVTKAPQWIGEGQSAMEVAQLWALSLIEPFGTLWFIYILPVFFIATRLVKQVPWFITLAVAALLEILPIHTGWLLIDEFASRYVYFLAGYLFAGNIFNLADWVKSNVKLAVIGLLGWAVINGAFTFIAVPNALSSMLGYGPGTLFLSDLPVVSLALGAAGAVAIILLTTLLPKLSWTSFLAYIGRHSIVVYLAFFLPTAVSRIILLKFAPFLDIGTVSALVTLAGVSGPIILHLMITWTGYGKFLFERPSWARIDRPHAKETAPALQPAE